MSTPPWLPADFVHPTFVEVPFGHHLRPIRADDRSGRVVYMSSFSKTLATGYRVAWSDAPPPIAAKLEIAKQASDLCTGELDQRIVDEACRRGILDRQAPLLRAHYRHKRDVMVAALTREFGGDVTWPEPRGGFFLWASIPPPVDTDAKRRGLEQHRFAAHRTLLRSNNAMNTGAPITAVTAPTGSCCGVITVRASVSASTSSPPPANAHAGTSTR